MNEFLRRLLFLPEQASTFAADVDRLHIFVVLTTILMSAGVGLTTLFFFAKEFYESSKRNPVDRILGPTPHAKRKRARRVTQSKLINAHAKKLGHKEMSQLMHHNKRDKYSDDKKDRHECISSSFLSKALSSSALAESIFF